MSKPTLVVAVADENYLFPLEVGLAERLYETAEIEIISDEEYFEEYFTAPRDVDVLVVDEKFNNETLSRHNIKKIFCLTEDMEDNDSCNREETEVGTQQIVPVFKYLNLQILINSIIPSEWSGANKKREKTQVIVVTAAEGGAGCTTVAQGISACLQQSLRKTLYINTQAYQNFQCGLKDKTPLSMEYCAQLRKATAKIYQDLKGVLRKEYFSYLPPLPASRYSMGIKEENYIDLIQAAQLSGEYESIVVDIGVEITPSNMPILALAEKVLIITRQQADSAFKMQILLHNLNCSDREKFHIICNQYDPSRENAYIEQTFDKSVAIDEYIEQVQKNTQFAIKDLLKIEGLQKTAYTLM